MVTLDRNQMQSVLLNMIINALDATEPGGQITVTTGIGIAASNPGQKGVEIVCNDTGCGIAPENLDKIFDPFFTTKEVGQGTGLGLSVSYGIVERHGGDDPGAKQGWPREHFYGLATHRGAEHGK